MQWGQPEMLHSLWLLIPVGLALLGLARRRERQLQRVMQADVLADTLPPRRTRIQRWRMICILLALALGAIALARPQWGETYLDVQHMGLDILVVLDTSSSMLAEDVRPNRLERSKLALRELVGNLRGDRIGLMPFAGQSYLYCPLTSDYSAFLMMLDDVYAGIIPRGGTAIEQALRRAIDSFDDHLLADRVILLITDGEDHEGNPMRLLEEMRRRNIRLFALGVGTPDGDLIPITDEQGRRTFLRDRDGNIVRTRLQEEVLERLAPQTGGMYVRAQPGDFGLDYLFEQGIAPLQRDLLDTEQIRMYEDRFAWFLGAAFILLLLDSVLAVWMQPPRVRWPGAAKVALLLLGLTLGTNVDAADPRRLMREGREAHDRGDHAAAAELFLQAAELASEHGLDPARAWFNRGNSLQQLGALEDAMFAYERAGLSTDPAVQEAARFNEGTLLLDAAEELGMQQQFDQALPLATNAVSRFQQTLTLNPANHDAKVNLEMANRLRQFIEEQMPPPPPETGEGPDDEPLDDGEDESDPPPEPPSPDDEGDDTEDSGQPDADPAPPHDDSATEDPRQADMTPDMDELDFDPASDSMDEMTQEEALMLLDWLRDEEQETRDQMRMQLGEPAEVEKDW